MRKPYQKKPDKPKCEGCGVIEHGRILDEVFVPFRGHTVCAWCKTKWKKQEALLQRTMDLEEYRKGMSPDAL